MFSVCSQLMWAHSHVMWSQALGYSQLIWSRNNGCSRFLRFMFSVRYNYRAVGWSAVVVAFAFAALISFKVWYLK